MNNVLSCEAALVLLHGPMNSLREFIGWAIPVLVAGVVYCIVRGIDEWLLK